MAGAVGAVGSWPATRPRVVRRRYDDEDVARLLRAEWWDWPIELVTGHVRDHGRHPSQLEDITATHADGH